MGRPWWTRTGWWCAKHSWRCKSSRSWTEAVEHWEHSRLSKVCYYCSRSLSRRKGVRFEASVLCLFRFFACLFCTISTVFQAAVDVYTSEEGLARLFLFFSSSFAFDVNKSLTVAFIHPGWTSRCRLCEWRRYTLLMSHLDSLVTWSGGVMISGVVDLAQYYHQNAPIVG